MGIGRVPSLENVERQRLGVSAHQTSQARPVGDPNKFIPVSPVTGIGCGPSEVTNGKANESDWNGGCCDVCRWRDGDRSGSVWRGAGGTTKHSVNNKDGRGSRTQDSDEHTAIENNSYA